MNRISFLILQGLRGEATPAEEVELAAFISASEANRKLVEKLEDADYITRALSLWEQIDEDAAWQKVQRLRQPVVPMKKRRFVWYAAAAAVLAFMAVGGYLLVNKKTVQPPITQKTIQPGKNGAILTLAGKTIVLDTAANGRLYMHAATDIMKSDSSIHIAGNTVEYATLVTPRGRKEQLTLADGTKVWLNAASSIRFPTAFMGDTREVEITGEAYFEVAHNDKQPFHVKVKELDIQDIGTSFNINAYDDEPALKTTLLEGAASVNGRVLHPGQQAALINNQITVNSNTDIEQVMAWKNGYFRFKHADIREIMRQVSRWYDVDIDYTGDLSKVSLDGYLGRKENVQKLLAILEATGTVHFKINDSKIIVSP